MKRKIDDAREQALQYNSEGYALSQTYKADSTPSQSTLNTVVHVIQGTNISLETPEDIEQWINERKKKWPSAANMAKKELKAKAKVPFVKQSSTIIQDNSASQTRTEASTLGSSSLDVALAALERQETQECLPMGLALQNDSASGKQHDAMTDRVDLTAKLTTPSDDLPLEDEGPEVSTSKILDVASMQNQHRDVPKPTRAPGKARTCKYYKQGRCTRGQNCSFPHDAQQQPGQRVQADRPVKVDDRHKWRKRKSLYERLVENELAAEKAAAKAGAEAQ